MKWWISLSKTGRIVTGAIAIILLVLVILLAVQVRRKIILFVYDRFVYPEQVKPVDFSQERDMLSCIANRVPERVVKVCSEAFSPKKR